MQQCLPVTRARRRLFVRIHTYMDIFRICLFSDAVLCRDEKKKRHDEKKVGRVVLRRASATGRWGRNQPSLKIILRMCMLLMQCAVIDIYCMLQQHKKMFSSTDRSNSTHWIPTNVYCLPIVRLFLHLDIRKFDLVPIREERVESKDQLVVAPKQARDAPDHSRCIDSHCLRNNSVISHTTATCVMKGTREKGEGNETGARPNSYNPSKP